MLPGPFWPYPAKPGIISIVVQTRGKLHLFILSFILCESELLDFYGTTYMLFNPEKCGSKPFDFGSRQDLQAVRSISNGVSHFKDWAIQGRLSGIRYRIFVTI
jgi:hypothetical protein